MTGRARRPVRCVPIAGGRARVAGEMTDRDRQAVAEFVELLRARRLAEHADEIEHQDESGT